MSEEKKDDALHEAGDEFELVKEEDTMLLDPTGIRRMASNLEGLKTSVDGGLKAVARALRSSDEKVDARIESVDGNLKAVVRSENFDAKTDALGERLSSIKAEIAKMNDALRDIQRELAEDREKRSLERAAALTHLNAFQYYAKDAAGDWTIKRSSAEAAREALQWFSLGSGYDLPDARLVMARRGGCTRENFRDQLAKQIKELTKKEPRLELAEGNNGIIYLD